MFEKVVPTTAKNIRGWLSNIIWGDASAHQVEDINKIAGEINGRIAS